MAALLVAMAVMAIMLSAAMPVWSQMIRREKEEELIFRGTQYARAINQYQRKYASASPASLDVLIEQRMLRKKFRDPLSPNKDGEFQLLYLQNQATTGTPGPGQGQSQSQSQSQGRGQQAQVQSTRGGGGRDGAPIGGSIGPSPSGRGAIVGVASKNTGQSIKTYKGKDHYNEWQFIGMEISTQGGPGGIPGGLAPGQRGGSQRGGMGGRGGGGRQGSGREGGTTITTRDGTFTLPPGGPSRGSPSREGR
jgi:type II secretory pathway pseudopilin PulG